jgi:protein gp37
MSDKSAIEWTDATWNPIVGCSIVSPGCTNCYAMKMAGRIERMGSAPHYDDLTTGSKAGPVWTGKVTLAPDRTVTQPLRWKRGRKIFVNSMGDLFHESIPDEWIDRVFAVIALCPQHTFQVLTKRADRMRAYLSTSGVEDKIVEEIREIGRAAEQRSRALNSRRRVMNADDIIGADAHACAFNVEHGYANWPLPNLWLGVSTERQQEADERIPLLLQTPAAVRFISAEPLLGPIDLRRLKVFAAAKGGEQLDALSGDTHRYSDDPMSNYIGSGPRLDWIIVGGESGPNARPMHPDWARSLRDQCAAAGVPFFFKQWGEWSASGPHNRDLQIGEGISHPRFATAAVSNPGQPGRVIVCRVGKKSAGRLLDGKEHNESPAVPLALRRAS